jgi:hypothetical protein
MSTYPLQDMVRVRTHREDQASQAVTRARRLLLDAREAVRRQQEELAAYIVWRLADEKRQLDSLMQRLLKLGEISDVRHNISLLRDREFELQDQLKQAESAVTKAEAHLEECRQRQVKAVRELEKLVEHRKLWEQESAREQELAEDLELEEFTPGAGGRFAAAPQTFSYGFN